MIPNIKHSPAQVTGIRATAKASIKMSATMFQMLSSDIYSNKPLAVVRETICNAKDSHVMSNEDRPLLVHLPNQLEKFFSIQDFGTGLSEQDVLDMYLIYGESNKRDTNSAIGGFGIGSKSPLAYTDSFMVTSNFEGTQSKYSIYKDEGIPNVSLLSQAPTTDPTGLTVRVAIASEDFELFIEAFNNFNEFFDYPIDVVGVPDYKVHSKPEAILRTDYYSIYPAEGWSHRGKVRALMGGVSYAISEKHVESLKKVVKDDLMLLNFEIGELEIAPSREALSENKGTIAKLVAKIEDAETAFYLNVQEKIDEEGVTPYEAYTLLRKYNIISDSGYNSNMVKVKKSCFNTFTFGDKPLVDLITTSEQKVRMTRTYGHNTYDTDDFLRKATLDKCEFLLLDGTRGVKKTAVRMSMTSGKTIIVISPEDLEIVQGWFGEDNVAPLVMSERYQELFPKVLRAEGHISIAKSGLFTSDMVEVREITPETEGYYFMFTRDIPDIKGMPTNLIKHLPRRVLMNLVSDMQRLENSPFKDATVYVCRKGGLNAIKKTKVKEVTWKMFVKMFQKCYTAKVLKQFITLHAEVFSCFSQEPNFDKAAKVLAREFPLLGKPTGVGRHGEVMMLLSRGVGPCVLASILPTLKGKITELKDAYHHERANFYKMFPIFEVLPEYRITPNAYGDLSDLVCIKLKKIKAERRKSLTGTLSPV